MLKPAAAVFIGIVAAAIAINTPSVFREWRAKRKASEMDRANTAIRLLTPDEVISRCGKPQWDGTWEETTGKFRMLTYSNSGPEIDLRFMAIKDGWMLETSAERARDLSCLLQ